MNRDDAIRMALDALECMSSWAQKVCLKPCFVPCDCLERGKSYLPEAEEVITALRAALAEAEEPVAWLRKNGFRFLEAAEPQDDSELPLYTHPPRREPLTEEEVRRLYREVWTPESEADEVLAFARAIERAHGIGENKPQDSLTKGATWERQK